MTRVRLYVDEDAVQHTVLDALRRHEIDVLTVLEAGRGENTDEEQLVFATEQGRTLYTLNVGHFVRLHRDFLSAGREHAGIVVIPRQRYTVGEKIRRLLSFVGAFTAEEMKNRLEYL